MACRERTGFATKITNTRSTGRIGMSMNSNQEIIIAILLSLGFCSGVWLGSELSLEGLESNKIEGYHCAPITRHVVLESAKAQVLINQARVAK